MNVLIVGAGKSGVYLAEKLRQSHEVTMVEQRPDRVEEPPGDGLDGLPAVELAAEGPGQAQLAAHDRPADLEQMAAARARAALRRGARSPICSRSVITAITRLAAHTGPYRKSARA